MTGDCLYKKSSERQGTATHCNTLQHTAPQDKKYENKHKQTHLYGNRPTKRDLSLQKETHLY